MARALRILFAGAHYHVINRGQGRRAIFLDEKDNKTFLNILSKVCETYKVNIVAYCLMQNHYHLIVHTPEANLSAFMRQLNGVYTQVFNQRYKHDGPLFKGRYKAIVVQAGSYLLRLIRYVHKNPERAGIANKCKGGLYTSHEALDAGKESDWLKFKYVLKNQNKAKVDLKKVYRDIMEKTDDAFKEMEEEESVQAVKSIIYGDQEYKDEIKHKYLHGDMIYEDIPEGKRIKGELIIDKVKQEIKKTFKIDDEAFYVSIRGKENVPRMMAMGLARECSGLPYKSIANKFGKISYKSVTKYYERITKRIQRDRRLYKIYAKIKQTCSQVGT